MLRYVYYFIWCITANVTQVAGLHMNLTEKIENKKLKYLPSVVLCIIYLICAMIFTTENGVMRMLFFASYYMYGLVAFKEKLTKKIIIISVITVIAVATDLIVELPVFLIRGKPYSPSDTTLGTIVICLMYGLLYMLELFYFTRINSRNQKFTDKTAVLFFLNPMSNMMLILAITQDFNDPSFWSSWKAFLFAVGQGIMILSMVMLYRAMRENYRAKQSQMKLAQLEYNQKLSESYFDNITQSAQMLMKYKHDFNNMITTALHMVNSNDESTKQQGVKLLEQIKEKNTETALPFYCKNPVVNTILFDKDSRAQTEGIDFITDVKLPEKLNIELTDLCSIFSNLIDNGLRSACESEDNRLELKAWCDAGYMFVRTKNYPDEDFQVPEKEKQFDISNISGHGYGLSILKDMAEKYGGSFEMKMEGGAFEAMCCVSLPETA